MSTMRDAPVLKAVADVVKDHVGKAFASLRDKFEHFDGRLKSIERDLLVKAIGPSTGDIVDIQVGKVETALVGRINAIEQQIKELPKPERGDRGDKGDSGDNGAPGKNAEPVNVEAIVKAVVTQIPTPKDGKDGVAIKGDRGASIRTGDGPPLFVGDSEDIYLDCKTGDVYRCG